MAPSAAGCNKYSALCQTGGKVARRFSPPAPGNTAGFAGLRPRHPFRQYPPVRSTESCPGKPPCSASPWAHRRSGGHCLPRAGSSPHISRWYGLCRGTSTFCKGTAPRIYDSHDSGSGRSVQCRLLPVCRSPCAGRRRRRPGRCSGCKCAAGRKTRFGAQAARPLLHSDPNGRLYIWLPCLHKNWERSTHDQVVNSPAPGYPFAFPWPPR